MQNMARVNTETLNGSNIQGPGTEELRGPLRLLTDSEVDVVDPKYIVTKGEIRLVWVCAAGHGPNSTPTPSTDGIKDRRIRPSQSLSADASSLVFQAGAVEANGNGIRKPWSNRSRQAHRPVGPGKHSHRNIGR